MQIGVWVEIADDIHNFKPARFHNLPVIIHHILDACALHAMMYVLYGPHAGCVRSPLRTRYLG